MVIAVVVTYRRTDSLRRTLRAARAQTRPPDGVVVVDNGGQAREALEGMDGVAVLETGENLGPAGGYEVGMREALARGARKIWLLDDDCEPRPECLATLLAQAAGRQVVVPRQTQPDGWEGYPPSWQGTLVDAEIVREVGFPDARLFFSKEDSEYFLRVRDEGYAFTRVPQAEVVHYHTAERPRGTPRDWKLYYEMRNHLHFWLRLRPLGRKGLTRSAKVLVGMPVAILLRDAEKGNGLRLWWWGVRDFLRGRMGRTLDPGGGAS